MTNELDRTPGCVDQLSAAMKNLGAAITSQGVGVSGEVDAASDRIKQASDDAVRRLRGVVDKVASSSERDAKSLSRATRALVGAILVLAVVAIVQVCVTVTAARPEASQSASPPPSGAQDSAHLREPDHESVTLASWVRPPVRAPIAASRSGWSGRVSVAFHARLPLPPLAREHDDDEPVPLAP